MLGIGRRRYVGIRPVLVTGCNSFFFGKVLFNRKKQKKGVLVRKGEGKERKEGKEGKEGKGRKGIGK
jgi:hypothetical protein